MPHTIKDYLRIIITFLLVIALGFLAFNQGMGYFYKVHFLKSPCGLCAELNPPVQKCIDALNKPSAQYWNPIGEWENTTAFKPVNITLPD